MKSGGVFVVQEKLEVLSLEHLEFALVDVGFVFALGLVELAVMGVLLLHLVRHHFLLKSRVVQRCWEVRNETLIVETEKCLGTTLEISWVERFGILNELLLLS